MTRPKIQRQYLSPDDRRSIYNRHLNGQTMQSLANEYGITKSGVSYIIKRIKLYGSSENRPKNGRPRNTSRHTDLNILRKISNNPKVTPKEIKATLKLNVSPKTIVRRIKSKGINPRIAAKGPYIDQRNQRYFIVGFTYLTLYRSLGLRYTITRLFA